MNHEQGIFGSHDNGGEFAPPGARWHRTKDMYKQLGSPLYPNGVVNPKSTLHRDTITSRQLAEAALYNRGYTQDNAFALTGDTFDALVASATQAINDHLEAEDKTSAAIEAFRNIKKFIDRPTNLNKPDKVQKAYDEELDRLMKAQELREYTDEILGEYNPKLRDLYRHKNADLDSARPTLLGRLLGRRRK